MWLNSGQQSVGGSDCVTSWGPVKFICVISHSLSSNTLQEHDDTPGDPGSHLLKVTGPPSDRIPDWLHRGANHASHYGLDVCEK